MLNKTPKLKLNMYQYILYKPRKDLSGIGANFQITRSDCFLSLAKQVASKDDNDAFDWADENKKPKCCIKLGLPDIGQILALFEAKVAEIKLFHSFEKEGVKTTTTINASPYQSDGVVKGYSFNITRGGVKYGIGISFPEAEILKVLFKEAILGLCYKEPLLPKAAKK